MPLSTCLALYLRAFEHPKAIVPPKSDLRLEAERAEKLYYRWEFIRRNKAYQADQAKFVSLFGEWFKRLGLPLENVTGHNQDLFKTHGLYRPRISKYFLKNIAPYVEAFSRKWSVSWPCSPSFTFNPDDLNVFSEKGGNYRLNCKNSPVRLLTNGLRLDPDIEKLAQELLDWLNPKREKFRENLEKFFPKESLHAQMENEQARNRYLFLVKPYDGKKENYERFHEFMRQIKWPKKKVNSKRVRLSKYGSYLRVWDLKQSDPSLTWNKIARRLYPRKFEQYSSQIVIGERNPAVQQVIDQYNAAERLIAGDFQEIR